MTEKLHTLSTVTSTKACTNSLCKASAISKRIIDPNKKLVALAFDDGPNTTTTAAVLNKLEAYGIAATFFLIGMNITEATKPVMQRELDLGCEICNHSWSHSRLNKMPPEQIKDEVEKTNDLIREMVGVTPKFFLPPYVAISNDMYDNIDLPFIFGITCNDWDESVTAEQRAKSILNSVKDGDIIVMHDFAGNTKTVDALDTIIQELQKDGYAFVTVSRLFELKGINPNVKNFLWFNTNQQLAATE